MQRGVMAFPVKADFVNGARCLAAAGFNPIICVSFALTVLGWSLIWACALSLVPGLPWIFPVSTFLTGLALIPLRSVNRRSRKSLSLVRWAACILCGIAVPALLPAGAAAADCPVSHDQLTKALRAAVKPSGGPGNGGLDNNEWAAVVTRDGTVCAVTFSGGKPDDQWPGSRAIAAEKANTANALSLGQMALSTANLYAGSQPGGPLYGLNVTNPVATDLLYAGDPKTYGSPADPFTGKHLGGVVTFGGGLALYGDQGVIGGLGVSGDTSCADHNIAWRIRTALGLDHVPNGVSPAHNDGIIYDMLPDKTSASGYGHAQCGGSEAGVAEQIHAGSTPQWAKVMQK